MRIKTYVSLQFQTGLSITQASRGHMCEIEGATRKWRERSVCFYLFRESTVLNENRSVTWFSSVVMLVSHMMVAQRLKKQIDYLPEHLIGQRNTVVEMRGHNIQKY